MPIVTSGSLREDTTPLYTEVTIRLVTEETNKEGTKKPHIKSHKKVIIYTAIASKKIQTKMHNTTIDSNYE